MGIREWGVGLRPRAYFLMMAGHPTWTAAGQPLISSYKDPAHGGLSTDTEVLVVSGDTASNQA